MDLYLVLICHLKHMNNLPVGSLALVAGLAILFNNGRLRSLPAFATGAQPYKFWNNN